MNRALLMLAVATTTLTLAGAAGARDFHSDFAKEANERAKNGGARETARGQDARARIDLAQFGGGHGGGYGGGYGGGPWRDGPRGGEGPWNGGGRWGGDDRWGGGGRWGGGTGPRYCASYAQGMVAIGVQAMRRGCAQYGPVGLHTNYNAHYNWCMRHSPRRVQEQAAGLNALLASCR
ncbi:MAG: hypothetical protein ACK5JM_03265 [Rhodoblastus sp.]